MIDTKGAGRKTQPKKKKSQWQKRGLTKIAGDENNEYGTIKISVAGEG